MSGVVVAPQPRAADVGAEVLAAGGNAFDAALATAFAQMAADPFMCGVGGMGTLQLFRARTGAHEGIDFHNRAGAKATAGMWKDDVAGRTEMSRYAYFDDHRGDLGYTAIMIPGTLAGLSELHARHCTRPWGDLMRPAIEMLRAGTEVTPFMREVWTRVRPPGIPDWITRVSATEACRKIYLKADGSLPEVGERIFNPDYVATLERIAAGGAEEFYQGALGREIAADYEANGAFVTGGDLAGYRVRAGAPLRGSYRGHEVFSNPPPGGGVTLIEMLHILEHFDLSRHRHGSAGHLDLVARAMAAAHADRNEFLGDPEFVEVPTERLLSKERAAEWADRIRAGGRPAAAGGAPPSCTTHLCTLDGEGNAVSLTHTIGSASGVVTPGLGFPHNNSMNLFDPEPGRANSIAPGKARTTGMCPTMVFRAGRPWLVLGAPGASVIISAVLQTILNIVDFGMGLVEAVSAPRIHCEGGPVHAEARVEGAACCALREMGHEVRQSPVSYDPTMARATLIAVEEGGAKGASDPRGGGGVARA